MGQLLSNPYLLIFERLLLAVLLLVAFFTKIGNPISFTVSVAAYKILPQKIVSPLAYLLLSAELTVGILLLIGWQIPIAAIGSSMMMLVFIGALSLNIIRKRKDLDCGCFGQHHHQKVSWRLVFRDFVLFLFSLHLIIFGGKFLSVDNLPMVVQASIQNILIDIILPVIFIINSISLVYYLVIQLIQILILPPMERNQ